MKVTHFWDMHSGGSAKIDQFEQIFIEGSHDEAINVFEEMFNRNPFNVTCECCGQDFSVEEYDSIEEATAYFRNCDWDDKKNAYDLESAQISVLDYLNQPEVLYIVK